MHLSGRKFGLKSRRRASSSSGNADARERQCSEDAPWEREGESWRRASLSLRSSAFSLRVDDGGGGGYVKINFERRIVEERHVRA